MLFREFAEYLSKLEVISSRLEITALVSEMIEKMDKSEVNMGVYLTQGALGPVFDNREFSMAGKMVVRAIANAFGEEISVVESKYKQLGDAGEVVASFGDNNINQRLGLQEVYEKLKEIAYLEGTGSQEMKVSKLSDLVQKMSALEGKFVARMVMGKLRLGFSEKTIFDALSLLESGNKSLRKELDKVYQLYPDSGELVKAFKQKGVAGLKEIKVTVGVPIVPALCQRLNTYEEIVKNMKEVAIEPKYDGTRVQIHFKRTQNGVFIKSFTRNLDENSAMLPELLEMFKFVKADDLILDCEAVGYNKKTGAILPFQETITRKRKHGVAEAAESVPLRFYCFDILYCNKQSLLDMPYSERRKILAEQILSNEVLVADEFVQTTDPKKLEEVHGEYLKKGYEGAVMKMWNGHYLPGRQGWNWVKIKEAEGSSGKLVDTLDLVILGYYKGRGKRTSFGMGAFLVGILKGEHYVSLAKIGTGLTDEEFKGLTERLSSNILQTKRENVLVEGALVPDVWVEPKVVVEIAADEITKSPSHLGGLALRFPRLVKFRDDRAVGDITTWDEVERIAKLSGNKI